MDQADEYVVGVPMHNFGVPSVLKLWVDQIARAGKTFSYVDGKPKGLIDGKKATAGGTMVLNQGRDRKEFLAPHLQAIQTHAQALQGGEA